MSRPIGFELHGNQGQGQGYPPMNTAPTYGTGYGSNYPPPPMAGHNMPYYQPQPGQYQGPGSFEPPVAAPVAALPTYSPVPVLTPVNQHDRVRENVSEVPPVEFEGADHTGNTNWNKPSSRDPSSLSHSAAGDPGPGSELLREDSKKDYRETEEDCQGETLYFRDGKRQIDYVIAYEMGEKETERREKNDEKRKKYQKVLQKAGLQLEFEDIENSCDGKTYFIKVHAPWEVLCKGAEIMMLKMPIKENDLDPRSYTDKFTDKFAKCCCGNPFELKESDIPEEVNYFTAAFSRERLDKFIIPENRDEFFTNAQRSRIVHRYLMKAKYGQGRHQAGISRMVANGCYTAAYPLHEGEYKMEHSLLTHKPSNDRQLLYCHWARPGRWYKEQPLDMIRKYFGEKIGVYFAWLGFYTSMLIPAAFVGLFSVFYGLGKMNSFVPVDEICNTNATLFPMCPRCDDKRCNYYLLTESSCIYAKFAYVLDNPFTVIFSIFMSFWATCFLEFWKRKQSEIRYEWDLMSFEDEEEQPRAEFENLVSTIRRNPITQNEEPYVPAKRKAPKYCVSIHSVLFMICLVIAAVLGVVLYRVVVNAVMSKQGEISIFWVSIVASFTAALINLTCIMILNKVYERVAWFLTKWELPRTQTNFDDQFTFKMYLFQFVNFYASLFYIAFFKLDPGRPGKYHTVFGYRREECNAAGCLFELGVQLFVIMVGKQLFNNFIEVIVPKFKNYLRRRKNIAEHPTKKQTRWEQDYDLTELPPQGLFYEYLEMVIQFGFITLFVAAFPLGPLFALFNNIIEIRVDSYKFIAALRRPMAQRAQDIGVWYPILKGIVRLSVVVNAFVIGFVSEFVPRLYYEFAISEDRSLHGFLNNSMSCFDVRDFPPDKEPSQLFWNKFKNGSCGFGMPTCRFRGNHNPPYIKINNVTERNPMAYQYSVAHWHIIAGKLFFVIVFEHVVFFLTGFLAWVIPPVPKYLNNQIKRENYLAREALRAEEIDAISPDDDSTSLQLQTL